MYSVLVVDDDAIIRRGLTQNISWDKEGFKLLNAASDGERALDIVEEFHPSIIISDIKMPFMDGMELSRIIREKYPDIRMILLTGYEEFEYAKEALKLKVFDYILKPVDKEVLLETVKRASWDIENEKKVSRQLIESIPLLTQRFLLRLINENVQEEEFNSQIEFLKIHMVKGLSVTACIKADDYFNSNYSKEVMEKELLKFSISNICNEILQNIGNSISMDTEEDGIVIIFTSEDLNKDEFINKIYETAESIREKVEVHLKTTVTIGVGTVHQGIEGIKKSYNEATATVEFRHMLGKNKVLLFHDTGLPAEKTHLDFSSRESEIVQKVKLGLDNEAIEILWEIKSDLMAQKFVSLELIHLIAMEITILLFRGVEGWKEFYKNSSNIKSFYELSEEIQRLQTIEDLFSTIKSLIDKMCGFVNSKRESQTMVIVKKSVKFIEENFIKEGLSLHDVAESVHVSTAYLSIIFKQIKNINFSDFLLEVRMNKAMELLRNGDYKSYEVAEKVGYTNPQYFSVCFKKYTGVSPSDFKNS